MPGIARVCRRIRGEHIEGAGSIGGSIPEDIGLICDCIERLRTRDVIGRLVAASPFPLLAALMCVEAAPWRTVPPGAQVQ
ncbi:hypothetical protein [Actinomadura sp. NPDC049753]|uniref:hypothetical protein n=1 Tax=Actinomadura sp. NPDC049753 TaxID=3154739 RepID=UPI0034384779